MRIIFTSYMLTLGILVGIEIAIGAFVAPVIFFPEKLIGEGVLTHFQSGIMMTQIFLRFNILLSLFSVYMLLVEGYLFIKEKNIIDFILSICIVILVMLFVLYFTPYIVEAQREGVLATNTIEFKDMHKQSEWVMKALMFMQVFLFFRKLLKNIK